MTGTLHLGKHIVAGHLGIALIACTTAPARAQNVSDIGTQIEALRSELQAQRALIESQAQRIERQQQKIDRLQTLAIAAQATPADRVEIAHSQPAPAAPLVPTAPLPAAPLPDQPVGGTPELARIEQQVQALPEGTGVLTQPGHVVFEPSFEYTSSSSNRLVFRGIELIPGIQIGQIDAGVADRDTLVATATARYGLADNLEIEARVPYLFRSDRTTRIQQRDDTTTQRFHLQQSSLGDIELGLRYQFNRPIGERPIFVGSLRVKSDTGKSPFSVPFDDAGVATGLATGSGFWAVQPGLSFLLPSEPAVIFGGASYLYAIPRTIDRTVGGVLIGRVHPGDAIGGNLGFGFALNQRFSFSLGYEHAIILPMRWQLNGVVNRTTRLQVGSFTMGMSYRLTRRQSLNFSVDIGATEDAPDVSVILRIPFAPD